MSYYSNDPYRRTDGRSYGGSSTQGYSGSGSQGYGGSGGGGYGSSSSQGYGRSSSSNQAYREPPQANYQSLTSSMAKVSVDDIQSWKDLEKANKGLYKACMEASKRLKKLEAKGKIRPFKVAYPKWTPDHRSSSSRPAPPSSSSGKYYPSASTSAPSYGGGSKVYGCHYCSKDYTSRDDRADHEERKHFPCPYCLKQCDDRNHRHDHKRRCPRRP